MNTLEIGDGPVVVSLGGNALKLDNCEDISAQREAAQKAAKVASRIFLKGIKMALTHGNGPQVGFIMERFEFALKNGLLHKVPLDFIVADTQGGIGYLLEQVIQEELQHESPEMAARIATLMTQVTVDPSDMAEFRKPVGRWMDEAEARQHIREDEWVMKNLKPDQEEGWRRVVPSPRPIRLVNEEAIRAMVNAGFLTICGGGGGVPVIERPDGTLEGVEAVVDKDLITGLIAKEIEARLMVVLTAVSGVIHPDEYAKHGGEAPIIPQITTHFASSLLPHLPKGSMRPKLAAAVEFTEQTGEPTVITDFPHAESAIEGHAGTRIIPSNGLDEV